MTLAKKKYTHIHIYECVGTAHVKTIINLKRIKLCTANNALELQNTNKIIFTISLSFYKFYMQLYFK